VSTYKVVRFYQNPGLAKEVIGRGLTFEEAQAHCQVPEASSRTATSKEALERTRLSGPWFDGYIEE
jgi:hypothetical protein